MSPERAQQINLFVWIDSVINLLPIVADRGWMVLENGVIRDRNGRCPICALANEIDPYLDWYQCAILAFEGLGFSDQAHSSAVTAIATAAHFRVGRALTTRLRQRLLHALGLTEAS